MSYIFQVPTSFNYYLSSKSLRISLFLSHLKQESIKLFTLTQQASKCPKTYFWWNLLNSSTSHDLSMLFLWCCLPASFFHIHTHTFTYLLIFSLETSMWMDEYVSNSSLMPTHSLHNLWHAIFASLSAFNLGRRFNDVELPYSPLYSWTLRKCK